MTTTVRDPAVLEGYARDASGLRAVPEGLARPATREELVEVMREAAREDRRLDLLETREQRRGDAGV